MNIGNISTGSITASVWAAATKNLSGATNIFVIGSSANTTIVAGGSVNFVSNAGQMNIDCFGLFAASAGTLVAVYTDGVVSSQIISVAAGGNGFIPHVMVTPTVFVTLTNNDGSHTASYILNIQRLNVGV